MNHRTKKPVDPEGRLRYRVTHQPEDADGARLSAQIDGVVIDHGEPVLLIRVTAAGEGR